MVKNIKKMDAWAIKQMAIWFNIKFIYGKNSKNIKDKFKAN